jgi:hypothetical protein
MTDSSATFSTEPHGDGLALYLTEGGIFHVLFKAAAVLSTAEQRQACENVRARIVRAVIQMGGAA